MPKKPIPLTCSDQIPTTLYFTQQKLHESSVSVWQVPGNLRVINLPYCALYYGGLWTAGDLTYSILLGVRAKICTIKQVNVRL